MNTANLIINMALRVMIRGYQWLLAPVLPGACRYHPSCSEYALEAVARHGALGGSWLALKRICRCHPWGETGPDPVPGEAGEHRAQSSSIPAGHN
ncbi:MAG: membrane protein insertion efficiency factor YidD [Rhodospirillales bacterium]